MPKIDLINANLHRAKEGARVLEDIARFILRDEALLRAAREIRHSIQISAPIDDLKGDLGGINFIEDNVRTHLLNTIQANAIRLQEALRVLEEMTETSEEKQLMKELRYQAYDLHSRLYYSARKYLKLHLLEGLYLIIDTDVISRPLDEIMEIINASPVKIVQYRNKSAAKKIIFENAYQIKKKLAPQKLFIINDHLDIALDLADGLHLGQEDYPLERIRNIVPDDFILGMSCHSLKEAHEAWQFGASYIAIGCLFETQSKKDAMPVSIDELKRVCDEIPLPICAIGGITIHTLDQVLLAKIKMAAVISSVWKTDNPLKTLIDMQEKIINEE